MKRLMRSLSALVLSVASLLTIAVPNVHAVAATITWSGTDCTGTTPNCNFSDANNWVGGVVPSSGDNLVFDATTLNGSVTVNNDLSGFTTGTLTLSGDNTSFYSLSIDGNDLTLGGDVSVAANVSNGGAGIYFDKNVVLGSAITILGGTGTVVFNGTVSGSGSITFDGSLLVLNGNNTFSGGLISNSGTTGINTASAAGSGSITINDGADLNINGCTDGFTVPNNMTLTGASSNPTGTSAVAKLTVGGFCSGAGGGATIDQVIGYVTTTQQYTLSGDITLGSDVVFGGYAAKTTLTGALSGSHKFVMGDNWGGTLILSGSSNSTLTPNGTYAPSTPVVTLSDDQATKSVQINSGTVTIDGKRGLVMVGQKGTLMGTGTVGDLSVLGIVAPGHSPGCLSSGNLNLNGTYQVQIGGTTACTGYDQLKVTGTVTAGGALDVSLYNGFVPKVGQSYTIIDNDGTDAVTGTFTGLAEGATVTSQGVTYKITYKGGDGNDVVLTVTAVDASKLPKTPNTGFQLLAANPAATASVTTMAAAAIFFIQRRMVRATAKTAKSSKATKRR